MVVRDGQAGAVETLAVLPLKRGHASILTFLRRESEYMTDVLAEDGTLSVVWRRGTAEAVIVMTGFRGSPPQAQ